MGDGAMGAVQLVVNTLGGLHVLLNGQVVAFEIHKGMAAKADLALINHRMPSSNHVKY